MTGRWHITWHSSRLALRRWRDARKLAMIRAGAAKHGLDLSALSDDDVKRACADTRIEPELDGLDAHGATRALARAVRRLGR
jgi:hypothetical protein